MAQRFTIAAFRHCDGPPLEWRSVPVAQRSAVAMAQHSATAMVRHSDGGPQIGWLNFADEQAFGNLVKSIRDEVVLGVLKTSLDLVEHCLAGTPSGIISRCFLI